MLYYEGNVLETRLPLTCGEANIVGGTDEKIDEESVERPQEKASAQQTFPQALEADLQKGGARCSRLCRLSVQISLESCPCRKAGTKSAVPITGAARKNTGGKWFASTGSTSVVTSVTMTTTPERRFSDV